MRNFSYSWIWESVAVVFGLIIATTLGGGLIFSYIQWGGNAHEVESGYYHRSAQLSDIELQGYISTHGIKSVLNLRGASPGQAWYDDEIRVTTANHVSHFDIKLSAYRELSLVQMRDILQTIARAPKPILVHCNSGADRTGLVTAIYLSSRGKSASEAQQALSIRYGHFPFLLWHRATAMDNNLQRFLNGESSTLAASTTIQKPILQIDE